jgi:hypothetical protein
MPDDIISTLEKPAAEPEEGATTNDVQEQVKSYLAELVGDGKKFKNEEALAKGKAESDVYIEQLKSELAGLREDLAKNQENKTQNTLEEIKQQLLNNRQAEQLQTPEAEEKTTPELSRDDIQELVDNAITQRETQQTVTQNIDQTNKALLSRFGTAEKAAEAARERLDELGISNEDFKSMASKSPTAAMALFGAGSNQSPAPTITQSTINTESRSMGEPKNVKEQFDELRRSNPTKYWTHEVQNEIFRLKKEGKYD